MNYSKSLTRVILKLKNENKNNSDNGRFKVLFLFTSELYVDKGGNCFVLQDWTYFVFKIVQIFIQF